mmetsp:Transcript_17590/g.22586  ORF Transcript_17590/g.22586 Transcript_17590/m.22586 type:complete len:170 (-) Transcript_17590:398-907(-)
MGESFLSKLCRCFSLNKNLRQPSFSDFKADNENTESIFLLFEKGIPVEAANGAEVVLVCTYDRQQLALANPNEILESTTDRREFHGRKKVQIQGMDVNLKGCKFELNQTGFSLDSYREDLFLQFRCSSRKDAQLLRNHLVYLSKIKRNLPPKNVKTSIKEAFHSGSEFQ